MSCGDFDNNESCLYKYYLSTSPKIYDIKYI